MGNKQQKNLGFTEPKEAKKTENEELIERESYLDTLIQIIGNKERGYAAIVGRHRITDWHPEKWQLLKTLADKQLEITLRAVAVMIEINDELKNNS